jgi:hypothetical protein
MSAQINQSIAREEENAMKAAADENLQELREESEQLNDDDEVITSKTNDSLAVSTKNSNDNVKKEAPEMNIQLQR